MLGLFASIFGPKLAKPVMFGLGIVLLALAFYFLLDAYGDSRFREGRAQENAAWHKANDVLVQQAADSSKSADVTAAARALDYAAHVEQEKEKVDDAIQNGTSPLDVLFGAEPAGVQSAGPHSDGNQAAR